ncbi:phosphate ABC transporter substrate-binding protein [Calothrix sp. NIES-3974]|uniref:phosphate ABC transporter substrate-binding protein n=1 Tax=Calothrix sp. NIES-3974 TaxID=2005462 RepID=UPI000B5F4081|nr:phosphate ABC transporter substrate-binding protein [Calothrix sp. NIES-3974]BAZ07070.1 phosphate-binding protein PstS-like protein [Calothrix sp. NIES-3974]
MSKSSGPPPIVFILILLALLGGGWWFFSKRDTGSLPVTTAPAPNSIPAGNINTAPAPNSIPAGTNIRIDGSTSMVTINENIKAGFSSQYPGVNVNTAARGTDAGIQALLSGQIDIAAISRPLTPTEKAQGLVETPIAIDAIAIVVGRNNPFNGNLTRQQVSDIFQGKINTWSAVNGSGGTIKVINRPSISGTYKTFQELVLNGGNFGTGANITSLPTDGSTILFQALGNDGIGYATYAQARGQSTVRVIPIDGLNPDSPAYPYTRQLYYAYKNPARTEVQQFMNYVTSPAGQQALAR